MRDAVRQLEEPRIPLLFVTGPARHARMPHAHIGFARQTRPIPIGYDGLGPGVIAVVSVPHARCQ